MMGVQILQKSAELWQNCRPSYIYILYNVRTCTYIYIHVVSPVRSYAVDICGDVTPTAVQAWLSAICRINSGINEELPGQA